jgi:serine/threonine-protein kinase
MMLRVDGDEATGWQPAEPTVFLNDADDPMFSPDGRWLAYTAKSSAASGTEVFVRPFSGPGGPWQISTGGGGGPVWSGKRPELFYGTPDNRIMVTSYSVSGDSFHHDKPRVLPASRFNPRVIGRSFDLHPDGNRFALAKSDAADESPKPQHVILIFNFLEELRRIAP